jgi:hypothetical protein
MPNAANGSKMRMMVSIPFYALRDPVLAATEKVFASLFAHIFYILLRAAKEK